MNALCHLAAARRVKVDRVTMRLALDIFSELSLLGTVAPSDGSEIYKFHLSRPDARTELERSATFAALART